MIDQMFNDTFEHLGIRALYKGTSPQEGSAFVECTVLIKEPEQAFALGDGQFVERIATFEIMSSIISNPRIGDFLYVNGSKYRIYQEPLLDSSGTVYEVVGVFVGVQNVRA